MVTGSSRAQSEVVGVALLVGVFATLAIIVGVVVIGNVSEEASGAPSVDLNVTANPDNVTVTHSGGATLDPQQIGVVVRGGDTERYDLSAFAEIAGTDASAFEPGERWRHSHGFSAGTIRVLVIHRPSNTVLYDETVDASAPPDPETPLTNAEPRPRIDYTPSDPLVAEMVTFNASNSTDDGTITSYAWDLDDDGNYEQSGVRVNRTFSSPGTYTVRLRVRDNESAANTTTADVVVTDNTPPVANVSVSPADPGTGETITVDGSNSTDVDGTITSYEWDFDEDGTTDATGETVTTSYATPGMYNVTLTVADQQGATNTTTESVLVNSAPVANVTWACADNECRFNATASSDDGTIANYTWAFDDGNTTTTTDPVLNHTYASSGEYNVMLTVTDTFGATNATTRTVDSNAPPTARFSASCPGVSGTCTFNATASSDDGTIANYTWAFDDGNTTTTTDPVLEHTYDRGGTYDVNLTVTDTVGGVNATNKTVEVTVRNTVWAINSGGGSYTASDGTQYVADTNFQDGSTASTPDLIADTNDDPLYQTERYGDFVYGLPVANGEYRVTLQFAETYWGDDGIGGGDGTRVFNTTLEGDRVVRALDVHAQVGHDRAFDVRNVTTVTDGEVTIEYSTLADNAKASAILVENFTGPNLDPRANFAASNTTVALGEMIQFNDTSTDPDGVVQSWEWDFGDGSTTTARNPSHNYSAPGRYTVELTVTDDDGATDTRVKTITVENTPPRAELYYRSGTPAPGEPIQFTNQSTDSDGTVASVEWDFGDGTTATGDSVTHSYDAAGAYSVELTVTDDYGATDTETVTVSALSPVLLNEYDEGGGGSTQTLLESDFESGSLATDGWTIDGGDGDVDTSTSNSGQYAAYHSEATGSLRSRTLDASGSASVTFSYWVRRGDDAFSENPESGEGLLVQYLRADGSWETIRTYAGGGTPGQTYSETLTLPSNAAHADLQVRFFQLDGSGSSFDYWHVDDVSVTATTGNFEVITTEYGVDLSAYTYEVRKQAQGTQSGRLGSGRALAEGSVAVNATSLGGTTDWRVLLEETATGQSLDCVAGGSTYQSDCGFSLSRQGPEDVFYRNADADTDTAADWDRSAGDTIGSLNPGQAGVFRPEHTVAIDTSFESGSLPTGWTANGTVGVASVTAGLGTEAAFLGEQQSDLTTTAINTTGADTITVTYWVRRGADSFSENPDFGEDLDVQYRAADGSWQTLRSYAGGGTPGEIYVGSLTLPADAVHEDFALRFEQLSGSGSGWDYWHVDDVRIETND